LASDNSSYTIYQQVNNLLAGAYSFSGYVNIPATSDAFTCKLEIRWRNASGSTLRTDLVKSYTGATGAWNLASANLTAPAGTTNAHVRMNISSLKGTIYVDDFAFQASAPATPTSTPTATATPTITAGATATATPTIAASATVTPVGTPTATAGAGGTFIFSADADTYVSQATPTANYATASSFSVVGGTTTEKQAFTRFVVSGLPSGAVIKSAKLRLYVTNDSTAGGIFQHISNNTWAETISWNTKPAVDGEQVASLGAVPINTFVEVDLSGAISGNGTYSFAITLPSSNTNTLGYASDETSTAANRPQLIITT
jgi:hypothetical protein